MIKKYLICSLVLVSVNLYGVGWIVTYNPSTGSDWPWYSIVDGTHIYAVGFYVGPSSTFDWRIEKRRISDGAINPTCSECWTVTSSPSTSSEDARSVTGDATYIYVAGMADGGAGERNWRIEKRNKSDGELVTTFGTSGVVTSDPGAWDWAEAITSDADYIYAAGREEPSASNYEWRIEKRLKSTGALSWAVTSTPSTANDVAYAIINDATYIYVAGKDAGGGGEWRIEKRLKSTGALSWAVTSDPSAGSDVILAITDDADYIYVAGYDAVGGYEWRIEKRLKSTGALVTGFGTNGVVISDPSTGEDIAYGITSDVDYIYVVGYDAVDGDERWRIEKRQKSDGAVVTAFGTSGVVISDPSVNDDEGYGITSDATYIYIVGLDAFPVSSNSNYQWRIEKRCKADGGTGTCATAVELVDFSAIGREGYIELAWRTEAEIDNYKWLVERAEVDKNNKFIRIDELPAKGSLSTYQLIDSLVTPGLTYWYKLGDVDRSGNITWHGPVMAKAGGQPQGLPLRLGQAIPSPFKERVRIEYQVPGRKTIPVRLEVYNESGQVIRVLVDKHQRPGRYIVCWDGKDAYGNPVSAGTYFYYLKVDGELTRKLIFVK